jgi:Family of unknown function (DUF6527)
MKGIALRHKFVESLPDALEDNTVYVCMELATSAHKCCCGCGREVITPLSPTDWKLIYDGRTVTLHPSIGNWNFPCRSHYLIRRNRVEWAPAWSEDEGRLEQMRDRRAKALYFDSLNGLTGPSTENLSKVPPQRMGPWKRLKSWWTDRGGVSS